MKKPAISAADMPAAAAPTKDGITITDGPASITITPQELHELVDYLGLDDVFTAEALLNAAHELWPGRMVKS